LFEQNSDINIETQKTPGAGSITLPATDVISASYSNQQNARRLMAAKRPKGAQSRHLDQQQQNQATVERKDHIQGVLAIIPAVFLSGFSGVFVEKVLKDDAKKGEVSFFLRNIQLSLGMAFAGVVMCFVSDREFVETKGFFHGFSDFLSLSLPFSHAVGGLLVGSVIKYANSIVRGFLTSLGITCGMMVDWLVFGQPVGFSFTISAVMVMTAILLYSNVDLRIRLPRDTVTLVETSRVTYV
jgi:UDP-galactose transporter